MDLLSTWRTLYTLRYCPMTLIQIVFSAGTVYLLTAKQAISGTRPAQKELRRSYSQVTLTLQYLDEIGKTWACVTKVTETLRSLMKEHISPDLDRKFIPASTAGPPISGDIGNDDEENGSRPSYSLSRSSQAMSSHQVSHSHSRTRSSGSGQSSLSTSLNHPLYSMPVPAQVSSSAQPLISPTITISPAHDADATSATIAIRSPRSPSPGPSTFPGSSSLQPNFSTSPSSSFVHHARELTPPGHPSLSSGNSLQSRFGRTGDLTDIENAKTSKPKAFDMTPQYITAQQAVAHISAFELPLRMAFENIRFEGDYRVQVGFNESMLQKDVLVEEIYLLLESTLQVSEDEVCAAFAPVFAPFPGTIYTQGKTYYLPVGPQDQGAHPFLALSTISGVVAASGGGSALGREEEEVGSGRDRNNGGGKRRRNQENKKRGGGGGDSGGSGSDRDDDEDDDDDSNNRGSGIPGSARKGKGTRRGARTVDIPFRSSLSFTNALDHHRQVATSAGIRITVSSSPYAF